MKMRKVLASLLAVSLIGASMSIVSYADGNPELSVTAYKYANLADNEAFKLHENMEIPSTNEYEDNIYYDATTEDIYLLTFSVNKVSLYNPKMGAGLALNNFEAYYTVSEGADKIKRSAGSTYSGVPATLAVAEVSKGIFQVKTEANQAYPEKGTGSLASPITVAKNYAAVYMVVEKDAYVKFDVIKTTTIAGITCDTGITLDVTKAGAFQNETTTYLAKNNTLDVTSSFTLGTPAATPKYATSVAISGAPTANMEIGATADLTATVTPADADDKTVTWSSSNPDAVTVSNTGKIEAVGQGSATITATANGSEVAGAVKATVTVTVNAPAFEFTCGAPWNNESGFVWAGCIMKNIGAGKTYTAKFTATGVADPYTKALDLNSKTEADGTITFDAVLNTTKTDVTFTVVED